MNRIVLGLALRERLGEEASRELAEFVERQGENWRADAVNTCTGRLESRLHDYANKSEIDIGFARVIDKLAETKVEFVQALGDSKIELANRLADMRVELLRWSFAFWIGQIVVLAALIRVLIR